MTSSCKLCGALPEDYDCAATGFYACPNDDCEMSKVELSWFSWESLNKKPSIEEEEVLKHQEGVRYELNRRRFEAAKAAMQGELVNDCDPSYMQELVERCVAYADALIAELEKEE